MADAQMSTSYELHDSPSISRHSCLRSRTGGLPKQITSRSVSFPDDDSQIVTGYLDPPNPWEFAENASRDSIISHYVESCERHYTAPIPSVLKQLEELEFGGERVECLNLKGVLLTEAACEALEEILKRVQFHKIDLESTSLDDEASVVLFDMIEYYEAATHINLSCNQDIAGRGWQACSRMLKKARCVEVLECRGTPLTEQYLTFLCRALRIGTQLQVLRLDNCTLSGRPMVSLVCALKLNCLLKELHLGENNLNCHDAIQLAAMLKNNHSLQLLDLSNNCLEDEGLSHLIDGLCEQQHSPGLSVLILWNNRLTVNSAHHFAKAISLVAGLEVLNVGCNNLGDGALERIREALTHNISLIRLGVQSTQLTCQGAIHLADIISENSSLQQIDVRENNILVKGLEALRIAMKANKSIHRLDIDAPRHRESLSAEDKEKYTELWDEVHVQCRENETLERDQEVLEKIKCMRKISLTCNTLKLQNAGMGMPMGGAFLEPRGKLLPGGRLRSPAPSPIPSPVTSPSPTRTRFHVSRVSEESPVPVVPGVSPSGGSRFKVTVVDTAPPADTVPSTEGLAAPAAAMDRAQGKGSDDEGGRGVVSRAGRRLTSWVNPSLLAENRAVEKLLGLLPWGRGGGSPAQDLLNNNSSGGAGATWPPQQAPPPPVQPQQHSASTPSLVQTGS